MAMLVYHSRVSLLLDHLEHREDRLVAILADFHWNAKRTRADWWIEMMKWIYQPIRAATSASVVHRLLSV